MSRIQTQQEEIKTIKPRTYTLNLSDADVQRLAEMAGRYNLTAAGLLEQFIGDLVGGTYSNGSDERMLAEQWAERCWFSFEPEKNLITYLCSGYYHDFHDFLCVISEVDSIKDDITHVNEKLADPEKQDWKDLFTYSSNDKGERIETPCYSTVEEYVTDLQEEKEGYEEALKYAEEELKEFQESFREYMGEQSYVWQDEKDKAIKWHKENFPDID